MSRPQIRQRPLSYADRLEHRSLRRIDLVVIHCTELPDLGTAREFGERVLYENSRTGNSGHFYIEQNGLIEQWVTADRAAHHVRGFNDRSIGIELQNPGRYPAWFDSRTQTMTEPYREEQIEALIGLLQLLALEMPRLQWIAGHQDLDHSEVAASDDPTRRVRRKLDPGPLFPWSRVLGAIPLARFEPEPGMQGE